MRTADVLIVGGGPAGSSLAWELRDAGLDVELLDRQHFPRDKTCAGWITPQVLDELGIDPVIYAKQRVLQPILGFQVRRVGDAPAEPRSDRPISYGIRRCEFDAFLLERCEARLRLGEPLSSLERRNGRWIANGELEVPLVVGAGGHFCPVARRLTHAGPAGEPAVVAKELEFALDPEQARECPVDPELPELYFTQDLRGYGWIFRKGDHLNVGLGRQDKQQLSSHLDSFLAFLGREGRLPPRLPTGFKGHAYLLYDQAPRHLVDEGLALIGDAAGLAYPRSGEGIRPAVESGLLLGRSLRASRGPADPAALSGYAAAMVGRFGEREPRLRFGITDLLPSWIVRPLVGRLFANERFARHVVIDRWFVHAHQAAL